jgi:hypothetical protein
MPSFGRPPIMRHSLLRSVSIRAVMRGTACVSIASGTQTSGSSRVVP